jgi:hypothetical protein
VWLLPKCSSIHIKASTKTERHWAKKEGDTIMVG